MNHSENTAAHYADSFQDFLDATNEKEVFVQALAANGLSKGMRLLDIGAGDGNLSKRILTHITPSEYVGVEQNPQFVRKLTETGVQVIAGAYPEVDTQLGERSFDTVLTSYSVPLTSDARVDFVETAFKRTSTSGRLNIISFGAPDQWTAIADEINDLLIVTDPEQSPSRPVPGDFMNTLEEECREFGSVEAHTITSEITAPSRDKLIRAIAFIATGGVASLLDQYFEAEEEVDAILAIYAPNNTIVQNHSFVTVNRQASRE